MDAAHLRSAEEARRRITGGAHDARGFRGALLAVPAVDRDGWVDRVLGLGALPDDDPALPRGCVPYLPCRVDALIEVVDRAAIGPGDVFVDLGAGVGRAIAVVHLLSGAAAVGLEIQPALARAAGELARGLSPTLSCVEGDAVELAGRVRDGTVFFLYCPFGGERLRRVLGELEAIAATREIRVCCVDLPLPACPWLVADAAAADDDVAVYRSRPVSGTRAPAARPADPDHRDR